ncbi:MAG: pilus assembly protein [Alphaproteobacteria bacterium]|nr:pilus assembly protein [Alphaproteobacteria bacterium]
MRTLRHFWEDRRGALLVEMAFVFPVLLVMILAGTELARYMLLQQKLDAVAVTTADLVSQREEISAATVDQIFTATDHVIAPFAFGANGVVIVTSVSASGGGGPQVDWQRAGGGSLAAGSSVGTPGGAATLPAGFLVRDGENAIIAEVYFNYAPLLQTALFSNLQMYHRSLFRPRFGTLSELQ